VRAARLRRLALLLAAALTTLGGALGAALFFLRRHSLAEINYDTIESTHGMDITFVTTAPGDDLAFALLKELGMPFRGNDKTGARA
jgi:ribosomal protein L5